MPTDNRKRVATKGKTIGNFSRKGAKDMQYQLLLRAYKEGDEAGIVELRKAVYPDRKYDLEHWRGWWRRMYQENPAGAGEIWLAERETKIVGQYPLILMNLKIDSEIIRVGQNIDLMTHPDHRRQRIFSRLEKHALDEAKQKGICVVIGFPNKAAHPGHIRSGWFDIAPMRVLFKPLNWENVLKIRIRNRFVLKLGKVSGNLADKVLYRAKRIPSVKGLTIARVSSFDERINELWMGLCGQYRIMVVRDRDYLNWRYCSVRGVDYSIYIAEKEGQVCGYLVLRCAQRKQIEVGIICDIFARSDDVAQCLVSQAIEHCKRQRVDLIYYSAIANKAYAKAFRKNGLICMPFIKGGRFCAYSSASRISKEFLGNPQNWLVQLGDSDMI